MDAPQRRPQHRPEFARRREFLSSHQCRVLQASDGVEALALLDEVPIDVLVTDIQMPGMSGLELIARTRQKPHYQALPVVVVTASALRGEIEAQLDLPRLVLAKPFARAVFLDALATYLPHRLRETPPTPGLLSEPRPQWELDRLSRSDRRGLAESAAESLLPRLRETMADSSMDGFVDFAMFLEEAGHRWNVPLLVAAGGSFRQAADDLDVAKLQQEARALQDLFQTLTASWAEAGVA